MKLVGALVLLGLVIALAVGGWAVYSGRGDFMPDSVKAAAAKAVGVAGNTVEAKKSHGDAKSSQEDSPQGSEGKHAEQSGENGPAGAVPKGAAEQISLPRALDDLEWGMNRAEIIQLYPIAKTRTDHEELVLTHYRDAAERYAVQFRFRDNKLMEVETQISPPQGGSVQELYETLKEHYYSKYQHFARSKTRWTDGAVTARIFSMGDRVYVSFKRETHEKRAQQPE